MNKEVEALADILGIQLTVKTYGEDYDSDQKNAYSLRKESIESLYLNDIVIKDLAVLAPYLKGLRYLHITNCTIPNFTETLGLNCAYLYFNQVKFETNDVRIRKDFPAEIQFSNMEFDASFFECFEECASLGVKYMEIKDCHVHNIENIGYIKNLYQIVLDNVTYSWNSTVSNPDSASLIILKNTRFKDVSFIPFKSSLRTVEFENCEIDTISGLVDFPKLKSISIDSRTTVKQLQAPSNLSNRRINLVLSDAENGVDLQPVQGLKNFIYSIHFENLKAEHIEGIEAFTYLSSLSFEKSIFNVTSFTSIANQLREITLRDAEIKNFQHLINFKHLTTLDLSSLEETEGIDLATILPLKKILKTLEVYDDTPIENGHLIAEFKALTSLVITNYTNDVIPFTNAVLTLKNLEKLNLSVYDLTDDEDEETERTHTFNIGQLNKLEYLALQSEYKFDGFEHLTELQALKFGDLYDTTCVDFKTIPKIESLKRLNVTNYDYKVENLERFPNLEFLKLKGVPELELCQLPHLKVLDLENSSITNFSTIAPLPNLERLDMSSLQGDIDIRGIGKFHKLKWISFLETYELEDISELKHLKQLEHLDLYATNVTDVSVLNELPNLVEANLLVGQFNRAAIEEQIDKPEIIVLCGLPAILFIIWEKDEFGI